MSLTEALNRFTELGAEWVLWLLLFLSVISITIMVERAIALYKRRGDAASLAKLVDVHLAEARIDELGAALKELRSVEAVVLRAGLARYHDGPAAAEEAMQAAQVAQRQELDRYLAFLGTVGSNAPFIGLAGTVIGIMQAFRNLGGNLQAGASSSVMSAIAEALVATLIGLLVAVPAVVAFNYFQRRIKVRINDTQVIVHTLLGYLKARPAAKAGGDADSKD
ncbi:MAG: MotA/TolQ/ExbB proton channel family protein [Deltaproteobacteria bacterium]|nr:MotA/TolQ/ExbB proton channel family protein [Deltaproteobacteria bacterium]